MIELFFTLFFSLNSTILLRFLYFFIIKYWIISFYQQRKNDLSLNFLSIFLIFFIFYFPIIFFLNEITFIFSFFVFTFLLILISIIDIKFFLILDLFSFFLLFLGIFLQKFLFQRNICLIFFDAFFGFFTLFIPAFFYKLFRKKIGLGAGDMKLSAGICVWITSLKMPFILFFASFLAIIFVLLSKNRAKFLPFAPFLSISAWLAILKDFVII